MRMLLVIIIFSLLLGCSKNHKTVAKVDLQRFMGDWYVIAILPNFIEKNATNGIESYALKPNGKIAITYSFNKGTPQGKKKIMHPKAKVFNTTSNAEWRVQFFWPFWYPYLIIDLAEDYRYTVIGVPNRKFVWIMSRNPELSEADYSGIIAKLAKDGYNTARITKMPQVW